ncbi:MAG: hypothetical protein KC438_11350, partial [Thermomicrobiales bacterium]|nr:hypothetical protein [Thermomicrobiales bacterium]
MASPTAAAATEPEDSQPFDIAGIRIDDSRLVLSFVLLALVLVALILVFDLIRDENREVRHWSAWLADRGIPISTEQIQASLAPSAGQQIQVDKDGNPIEPPSFQIKGPAQLIAGAPATFEIVDDAGNPQPQVAATWAIIDGTLTASDVHLYQEIGSKNT